MLPLRLRDVDIDYLRDAPARNAHLIYDRYPANLPIYARTAIAQRAPRSLMPPQSMPNVAWPILARAPRDGLFFWPARCHDYIAMMSPSLHEEVPPCRLAIFVI